MVGIDGSAGSRHALAWAIDEAVLRGAPLTVIHTWQPPVLLADIGSMAGAIDPTPFEEAARGLVTRESEAALAVATTRPAQVETEAVLGSPAPSLRARAEGADLLVVGNRGRGGFTGLLLGSVSQQCAQHATGPVAVIPATAPMPGDDDVVVGVDGSEGSRSALRWAIDEAAARGARLSVVHTWWTPIAVPPTGVAVAPRDSTRFFTESTLLLHEMVDGAVAQATRQPPDVELLAIEEPAVSALLHRVGRGAGLLVVGNRGRGGFAGLLLGSVSQQCATHAPCAVVVVPPPRS